MSNYEINIKPNNVDPNGTRYRGNTDKVISSDNPILYSNNDRCLYHDESLTSPVSKQELEQIVTNSIPLIKCEDITGNYLNYPICVYLHDIDDYGTLIIISTYGPTLEKLSFYTKEFVPSSEPA